MFGTVEELWRDHLFNPLGTWIAEELWRAAVLAFYQTSDKGATWAELHEDEDSVAGAVQIVEL